MGGEIGIGEEFLGGVASRGSEFRFDAAIHLNGRADCSGNGDFVEGWITFFGVQELVH